MITAVQVTQQTMYAFMVEVTEWGRGLSRWVELGGRLRSLSGHRQTSFSTVRLALKQSSKERRTSHLLHLAYRSCPKRCDLAVLALLQLPILQDLSDRVIGLPRCWGLEGLQVGNLAPLLREYLQLCYGGLSWSFHCLSG